MAQVLDDRIQRRRPIAASLPSLVDQQPPQVVRADEVGLRCQLLLRYAVADHGEADDVGAGLRRPEPRLGSRIADGVTERLLDAGDELLLPGRDAEAQRRCAVRLRHDVLQPDPDPHGTVATAGEWAACARTSSRKASERGLRSSEKARNSRIAISTSRSVSGRTRRAASASTSRRWYAFSSLSASSDRPARSNGGP